MALSRVLSPVMVGREAELSTLEDALLSALRGDGGVVIVGGEAGMGKTRLVSSLASTARRLGAVVIAGGCSEAELSLPYLPFLEAIGNYLAGARVAELRGRLGPAVVGNLAESANLSVLGEVTNLASRLQARAEAGEVLIADEVFRRSREWLEAQRIPAQAVRLELKGFANPVSAYRVRSAVAAGAPA